MQLNLFQQDMRPDFNLADPVSRSVLISEIRQRIVYNRELFYTPAEVAILFRVSYFQVFYLCKWFRLVGVKIHNLTRIPAQELIEYLEDYDRIEALKKAFYTWLHSREPYVAG